MTVSETLGALGSWSLNLAEDTPDEVLRQLGFFGHIVILRGDVDVTQAAPTALLQAARYVGVLRAKPDNARTLEGAGLRFWLGDEDNKGKVREAKLILTSRTLAQCVPLVLPPTVHAGTVNAAAGTYTGTHQWETPRKTLDTIATAFGVEYRVNGDFTVDVGTQAQLYRATPNTILSARGAGADLDVASIGTDFRPGSTAVDYTTRAVLLGQTTDQQTIVEATADAPSVPYLDPWGNPVAFTRMISDSGQTTGSAAAAVQLQLNRFNRTSQAIKVTAEDYEIQGTVVVGDNAWVYDPDNGIVDPAIEKDFHGEKINPAVVRISAATWPVTVGHTVAFRTGAGAIIDLTRWVAWETGTTDITVGDLPKSLTNPGNPAQDRANGAADASIPTAPTGLTLATSSVQSVTGVSSAAISASWTAPALNTDGSVITDLSYYLVQYRWHGRAPLWDARITSGTSIDLPAADGLLYDVQVSAVDLAGNMSAPTAIAQITAAKDNQAPNAPSDPIVDHGVAGQLRVYWDGKDNVGGAMPADFGAVEVHVSSTSGFTPDSSPGSATLAAQLGAAGYYYPAAPYGATRYVKLVAVDESGNRSAPSGQASGATVQTADGDIASLSVGKLTAGTLTADVVIGGRFATALTGARVEVNSLGFQKFAADGVTKLISLTGTEALLTGTYKSASSGRRIEMGSGGAVGEVDFYAPDGTLTQIAAFTAGSGSPGAEAIRMGVRNSAATSWWNAVMAQSNEIVTAASSRHMFFFGGDTFPSQQKNFQIIYTPTSTADGSGNFPGALARFIVDVNTLTYYGTDGSYRWAMTESLAAVKTPVFRFTPTGNSIGRVDMADNAGNSDNYSPTIMFVTETNIGGKLYMWEGAQFQFTNPAETGYYAVAAAAFNVSSDVRFKEDVAPFTDDALGILAGLNLVTFRRKNAKPAGRANDADDDLPGSAEPAGVTEVGVLAHEAHDLMRRDLALGQGVDVATTTFLAVAAIRRLDEHQRALDERLTALEAS